MIIYQIKCDEEVWHDQQKDGRWWRMVNSSRVPLNGPRKFGVCNGSYICENPECTKVTTEGVQNLIEFKQEKDGGYTCKCCGYYVHKRYCGCLKVTEYDKDACILTILLNTSALQNLMSFQRNMLKQMYWIATYVALQKK